MQRHNTRFRRALPKSVVTSLGCNSIIVNFCNSVSTIETSLILLVIEDKLSKARITKLESTTRRWELLAADGVVASDEDDVGVGVSVGAAAAADDEAADATDGDGDGDW